VDEKKSCGDISIDKNEYVQYWLHVPAVISRFYHNLSHAQPQMRSCRHCSSPLRQHHARAAGALPPAPHFPRPCATRSSRGYSAPLHHYRASEVLEDSINFWATARFPQSIKQFIAMSWFMDGSGGESHLRRSCRR
jgi:hypothetical protein